MDSGAPRLRFGRFVGLRAKTAPVGASLVPAGTVSLQEGCAPRQSALILRAACQRMCYLRNLRPRDRDIKLERIRKRARPYKTPKGLPSDRIMPGPRFAR